MVGLFNAPTSTRLHKWLKGEGRLLSSFTAAIQKYPGHHLFPQARPRTIKTFLKAYKPLRASARKVQIHQIKAFFKSIRFLWINGKGKRHYWRLFVSYRIQSHPNFPDSSFFLYMGIISKKSRLLPICNKGFSVSAQVRLED
jgi:hypothetical protein